MAQRTFTNEQLAKAWSTQARAGGTRGDVVRALLADTGQEDNTENFRKMYNNITQRVKGLSNHPTRPINFPELKTGKRGGRQSVEELSRLQDILSGGDDTDGNEPVDVLEGE